MEKCARDGGVPEARVSSGKNAGAQNSLRKVEKAPHPSEKVLAGGATWRGRDEKNQGDERGERVKDAVLYSV